MARVPSSHAKRPLVLLPSCQRVIEGHVFHTAARKYIEAVRLAQCMPVITPAIEADQIDEWLDTVHGILLTGSPSNVHPSHFGQSVRDAELPLDPQRDALTLSLIPKALARGIPLFAICRGFQEVNVALGGSLHQAVHEVPGFQDHREDDRLPVTEQYSQLSHTVRVVAGGVLERIVGSGDILVNSLHGQGIERLAPGLRVEAVAPDGLVEAFCDPRSPGFNLAVQWHPEWLAASNPVSVKLFEAFGLACLAYAQGGAQALPGEPAAPAREPADEAWA